MSKKNFSRLSTIGREVAPADTYLYMVISEVFRSYDGGGGRMTYYNVIIGFFDGTGALTVPEGRFYRDKDAFPSIDDGLMGLCRKSPTVFSPEISRYQTPMAHIGWITNISRHGKNLRVEYRLASGIAPIPADRLANALGLSNIPGKVGYMQHSQWEINQGDIFETLFRAGLLETTRSSIFTVSKCYSQDNLVSVMMPFSLNLQGVYQALAMACGSLGLECKRADDIWEDTTIIQDIFSLIYQSKIVICDFTGKNPNVFYEAGIAHALGRDVVPIVQHPEDIPFDLRPHRYIQYLNNAEGLQRLIKDIKPRLETLMRK